MKNGAMTGLGSTALWEGTSYMLVISSTESAMKPFFNRTGNSSSSRGCLVLISTTHFSLRSASSVSSMDSGIQPSRKNTLFPAAISPSMSDMSFLME